MTSDKQVYEDIGSIKKGIERLEVQTAGLGKKVDFLNGRAVTQEECHNRSGRICGKIDEIKGILEEEIEDTRAEVSQVTDMNKMPRVPKVPWLIRIGKYAGAITTVLALLGLLGGSALMMSRFIAKVETSLETSRKLDDRRGKRFDRRLRSLKQYAEPVIVPFPVPTASDIRRRSRGR